MSTRIFSQVKFIIKFIIKGEYEQILSNFGPSENPNMQFVEVCLRNLHPGTMKYLRNLFKKKRTPATHVLVAMLSDEKRNCKPYALPVRYVPYHNISDKYIREFTRELKVKMVERGLIVVGK